MNELSMLKKENRLRMDVLKEEDRLCIGRITLTLKGVWLRPFELEVMRKELIGMALEARQRGSTLTAALGVDEEKFCADFVNNCRRASPRDIAYSIGNFMRFSALLYLVYAWLTGILMEGFWGNCRLGYSDFFILILWPVVCSVLENWLGVYAVTEKGIKKHAYSIATTGLLVLVLMRKGFHIWNAAKLTIPVWLLIAVLTVYCLVFSILYRRYISGLSKEYHWQN